MRAQGWLQPWEYNRNISLTLKGFVPVERFQRFNVSLI